MASLRRILKYLPVLLMSMLFVGWGLSAVWHVHLNFERLPSDSTTRIFSCAYSSIAYWYIEGDSAARPMSIEVGRNDVKESLRNPVGSLTWNSHVLYVPFAVLLTAVLPLAVGAFTDFRFRLWQLLAYIALVAVELAYYMQWHD